jgi:hypothetical protein
LYCVNCAPAFATKNTLTAFCRDATIDALTTSPNVPPRAWVTLAHGEIDAKRRNVKPGPVPLVAVTKPLAML